MTQAEWDACADPTPMLEFLRGKAGERKLRLFACACCRRIWRLLANEQGRQALISAERSADDPPAKKANWMEWDLMDLLMGAVDYARYAQQQRLHLIPPYLAPEARRPYAPEAVAAAVWEIIADAPTEQTADEEKMGQTHIVRDIFGNPFRSVSVSPTCLAWNDGAVRKLARVVYDGRRFGDLPLLADALEDAGCTDAAILSHCPEPGEHVRGCWVVDLLLGKT